MAFGLTPEGFIPKRQSEIISEIEGSLRTAVGESINLQPESLFGQIVGIISEQLAEIWELDEAVYASQYPAGAEGTSVDNILALNGLKRLPASPSRTAPTTAGIPGLLLFGTPATIIPSGSLISIFGQTQYQFSLVADVTIENPVDEVQVLYFTSVPNAGVFKINIGAETTANINFDATAADVQTAIRLLAGYDDVVVTGAFSTGFVISFDGDSGEQEQPAIEIEDKTLMNGITVVNVRVVENTKGAPAQGAGSAVCTQDGPIPAPAGTLTVIDTPVAGWTSVNNPLDVIVGSNEENDTEALARRDELLESEGNGPIQSIVQKVLQVEGVTAAIGFENRFGAAVQGITFSDIPTAGSFDLFIAGLQTGAIPYTATAADVQTALRALSGYELTLVSGDFQFGFEIDFNGSQGGQPQDILQVLNNTLANGPAVTATVAFGLPGHSFEIVVVGGESLAIATAIYDSKPAGIESYGDETEIIIDENGNDYPIHFSRPDETPVYVEITLTAKTNVFPDDGVTQIQEELTAIGDAISIGGLIIGFGSEGLIGAFNNIPGIVNYEMFFGLSPSPTLNDNIQMLPHQKAFFESFNIIVNITFI